MLGVDQICFRLYVVGLKRISTWTIFWLWMRMNKEEAVIEKRRGPVSDTSTSIILSDGRFTRVWCLRLKNIISTVIHYPPCLAQTNFCPLFFCFAGSGTQTLTVGGLYERRCDGMLRLRRYWGTSPKKIVIRSGE